MLHPQTSCFPCFTGLRIRLQVWPQYRHNTQFLSLFAQRRRRISAQVICRWKLESLAYNFVADNLCLSNCAFLFRSFVPKRGSRIQWNRRRKQISALKWHVEVIQGQSFYAHGKADTLRHVAVFILASALITFPSYMHPKWPKNAFLWPHCRLTPNCYATPRISPWMNLNYAAWT